MHLTEVSFVNQRALSGVQVSSNRCSCQSLFIIKFYIYFQELFDQLRMLVQNRQMDSEKSLMKFQCL